jgi:O-antigen ligase
MIRVLILVGTVAAGFFMFMQESSVARSVEGAYGRARVFGGASGIAAQVVGLGVLTMLAFLVLKGSASRPLRYAALIGLPLGVAAILLSGSRSSLLYLFLVAMVLPFLVGRGQRSKAAGLLGLLLPLTLVIVFAQLASGHWEIESRWTQFMERRGQAVESRTRLFAFVAANWSSSPIVGHGCGSFAMDYMGVDDKEAPHNIVLEALYEAGLLGAALVLLFFFFAARTAARGLREIPDGSAQDRLLVIAPILMTLFLGLRSMSSVDMAEIRYLYLACGLLHANVSHLAYSNRHTAPPPGLSLTRASPTGMR